MKKKQDRVLNVCACLCGCKVWPTVYDMLYWPRCEPHGALCGRCYHDMHSTYELAVITLERNKLPEP